MSPAWSPCVVTPPVKWPPAVMNGPVGASASHRPIAWMWKPWNPGVRPRAIPLTTTWPRVPSQRDPADLAAVDVVQRHLDHALPVHAPRSAPPAAFAATAAATTISADATASASRRLLLLVGISLSSSRAWLVTRDGSSAGADVSF